MKDKSKNLTSSEKLAAKTEGFFSRNYRLLIVIVVVVLLICAGIGIWSVVSSNGKEATANAVYSLEEDYNALFLMDSTTNDYTAACDQFVADAEAILASTSSDEYANIKTNYLLGLYYFSVKDWNNAAACFDTAANNGQGTYLGSLSLANAAASSENAGDQDAALAYYNRIWDDYGTEAPESPKALFNAARIYEAQGDIELAIATYSQLADQFGASEYANLANARLIVLE